MLRNLFLSCFVIAMSCKAEKKSEELASGIVNKSIKVVDFEGLEPFLRANDDKTYVVNFWATWCKPCVKELPYFQELDDAYEDENLKILLVSLDFPEKLNDKLIPFIEKYQLQQEVILLDAPNENEWIPKVDSSWSGAIPATLIFTKSKHAFYEQSFTKEQLFDEVEKFTKNTKI
ncbi:MAG: TlpA disulfide reductase family protein [Flavobacteriaceae bacterium]|nr:TlpA disulfide reductase family protein [Flavobacteriaceae bacterium]